MRLALTLAAIAALTLPAHAQQPRQGSRPPAQAQTPPPPLPGMFPCRTEAEVCYVAVVTGPSQVAILFTNAPGGPGMDGKPISVQPPGDLGQNVGRVVMLTGEFNPQAGLTNAQVVEVASPLVSLLYKATMGGGEESQPAPRGKQPPRRR
jgi:hypothetical protein